MRSKHSFKEQLERLAITSYRLDDILFVPAAETNPQTEIVQTLATAVETITGVRPRLEGSGPACDGWMFITRGIPTVCGYGVACGGVHGADEWVDLASVRVVTEVYAHTILRFCGDARFLEKKHMLNVQNHPISTRAAKHPKQVLLPYKHRSSDTSKMRTELYNEFQPSCVSMLHTMSF